LATIVLAGLVAGLFVVTEELPVMPDPMAMERSSGGNNAGASLISLPADDAPHDDVLTEWWYYNGHLRTKQGKRYSFHYVIFLRDTLPIHTVAHVSLTDHKTGRHYTDQKRTAGNPSSNTRDRFNFNLGQWVMAGAGGNDTLKVETPDFAFDLSLTEGRSPVMHGGSGLLDFEQAGASYYYSRTRMNATGKVWLQGKGQPVTGRIWFDHQWGDFRATMLGWDWFAFQLDDGTDIMLYQLRDAKNRPFLHSGTIIQNGQVRELSGDDFQTKATGAWTSNATGIKYPMGWRVRIPGHKLNLKVAPVIRNSEFDARATTYNAYWEGAVRVTGSHSGVGFVELGGYSLGEL
jgi:predicted secreted hydrolase